LHLRNAACDEADTLRTEKPSLKVLCVASAFESLISGVQRVSPSARRTEMTSATAPLAPFRPRCQGNGGFVIAFTITNRELGARGSRRS
jgi:hypothetical protein